LEFDRGFFGRGWGKKVMASRIEQVSVMHGEGAEV
jgi:hypothetical protein